MLWGVGGGAGGEERMNEVVPDAHTLGTCHFPVLNLQPPQLRALARPAGTGTCFHGGCLLLECQSCIVRTGLQWLVINTKIHLLSR